MSRRLSCLAWFVLAIGCAGEPTDPPATGELAGLPTGAAQWKRLCATGYGDPITATFCAGSGPPPVASLAELQTLLGFRIGDRTHTRTTMTGMSTGVGVRKVTALNPSAIVFTPPPDTGASLDSYTILAFARGEPLVELLARDPAAGTLRFFLLRFHLACESTSAGCNHADLLTPSIESDWTAYTLYDDETIKNTTLDCRQCHQGDGPNTPTILRMQELRAPWNHWFASVFTDHRENDFHAAHGDASYAGIARFGQLDSPADLELLVAATGFAPQPNEYDSASINTELRQSGSSATWDAIYDRAVAGLAIAPPYHSVDPADRAKLDQMIAAYQQVAAGTLAREQMPDISDTLNPAVLPAMSIRPKAGLDGRGILRHMCAHCHNSRLDQTQSRALFNVETLDAMSRAEKDVAIARMLLDDDAPGKMPPPRFHVLSVEERDLAIQELSR